jgi:anaerobic C4-dicarboxylate transporter
MLKKVMSAALISVMSFLTCFAQTASAPLPVTQTQAKLIHADFYKIEPIKYDFEKESLKSQTKRNNLSSGAKTALWISLFAAGVITVVVLATRKNNENNNSPCGRGITTPCPPGCFCTQ